MQDGDELAPRGPISRGLRFRVAAVLALALLPIGVVGILQTRDLSQEVRIRTELTLQALTDRASFGERQVIERAFGAAEALSSVLLEIRDEPESCRRYLSDYLEATGRYSFIGFLPPGGVISCSSAPATLDLSQDERLDGWMATIEPRAMAIANPQVSTESVLNIQHPIYEAGDFVGYVSISVPERLVMDQPDADAARRPSSLITFNAQGSILTESSQRSDALASMPDQVPLALLFGGGADTFAARDQFGQNRTFVLMPVIPDLIYSLAAWPPEQPHASLFGINYSPALFPLLMFLASVAVAYFAVDRLAVRHVAALQGRMNAFARNRSFDPIPRTRGQSSEFEDLNRAFTDMAYSLLDDEARMEDALREKNVLLKEVHHRVKNNLQLISSIMNMKIRRASQPETIAVLKRLQERIMGLSTVHRNLYQTENLSRSNAGRLLSDLFGQLISSGAEAGSNIDYRGDFDDVILFPDQAVPLALLASELATNALKYAGAEAGGRPTIRATLSLIEPGIARLTCRNSVGGTTETDDSTGLGAQLIRAFAAQVGGEVQITQTDDLYDVVVTFKLEEFMTDPADH